MTLQNKINDDVSDSVCNIAVLLNNDVKDAILDSVYKSVHRDVRESVHRDVYDSVNNSVYDSVYTKLKTYDFTTQNK